MLLPQWLGKSPGFYLLIDELHTFQLSRRLGRRLPRLPYFGKFARSGRNETTREHSAGKEFSVMKAGSRCFVTFVLSQAS